MSEHAEFERLLDETLAVGMGDEYFQPWSKGLEVAHAALIARHERVVRERDEARTILAHTDIGSLPDDWTLKQVAEARIDDLMKLRDQVRDTCARAEKAEAENARLRQISTQRGAKMQLLREYFTPTEWHNFVGIRPEAAAWFDSDGVPIDAARKL